MVFTYANAPRALLYALMHLAPPHALLVAHRGAHSTAALPVPTHDCFHSERTAPPRPQVLLLPPLHLSPPPPTPPRPPHAIHASAAGRRALLHLVSLQADDSDDDSDSPQRPAHDPNHDPYDAQTQAWETLGRQGNKGNKSSGGEWLMFMANSNRGWTDDNDGHINEARSTMATTLPRLTSHD
ncbi:hypothetical protein BJV78DRAFT_1358868 [Lactifluus subvellereus]|nr:hypothetical protein BJV78DRAFT_1358868 [Lactifluus subvellereus]